LLDTLPVNIQFHLEVCTRNENKKADRPSKRLDWKVDIEKDNKNQTLIKEQWIYKLVEVVIEEHKVEIVEKIKTARKKNEEVVRVVEEMKKAGVKILQENE